MRPLGVLGWPAFSNRDEQPYNWLLYSHLRDLARRVDVFFSLFPSGLQVIREHFPALRDRPGFAVPHGHRPRARVPATR